jgi:hypothetical protein
LRKSLLLSLLAVCAWTAACSVQGGAPAGVTLNPAMAKGPSGAPVTVVEFSDYQ